jgi:transglutaminase-like putative cysteine protease
MIHLWENSGALEFMELDGKKLYFHNAGPNLFRVDSLCREIKKRKEPIGLSGSEKVNLKHLPKVITEVCSKGVNVVEPKRMKVTYTITVSPNVVPDGKVVRCWLLFPHRGIPRQTDIQLISASEDKYELAPDTAIHSTLYMEKLAEADKPIVFSETFEYTSSAEWHPLKPENIKPYDKSSDLYKVYTSEREKHVVFSKRMKDLAIELTGNETNPLLKARRIFQYINDNYPWASAREYSTIDNIPEYVLDNHKGDCGQVTLLFITLCRISGIPAHFQSGFMVHPGENNLHDWCEIYLEGPGWVPVDMSFGIPIFAQENNDELYWFFLGGIDSWRMIVNQDYGKELHPAKKYPRSETVDFQRGEVEWEGGNLYFDKWDYRLDVEYK